MPERWVGPPKKTEINSPWALWIHDKNLYIAMAGPHQIWKMPLDESEIGPYAGNGREDIVDGPLLPREPYEEGFASFAQPSGLTSDGEWLYVADSEGSSIRAVPFDATKLGHSIAADVRRPLYWDLFSGAFGHTYGHHSVWQMFDPKRGKPINSPLMSWREAIEQPGAAQMQHGRALMESRPFLMRIPDDTLIVTDRVATSVPGAGTRHFTATRDESGSYAMVYAPVGRPFKVRMERISGTKVKAWWFNPRDGSSTFIGEFPNTGAREFLSPDKGEHLDWVLVLDDAAKGFPAPGSRNVN